MASWAAPPLRQTPTNSASKALSSYSHLLGATIYANDGTYLGLITTSKYHSDSIINDYGTYGSKYNSTSIRNTYGTYGSPLFHTVRLQRIYHHSTCHFFRRNCCRVLDHKHIQDTKSRPEFSNRVVGIGHSGHSGSSASCRLRGFSDWWYGPADGHVYEWSHGADRQPRLELRRRWDKHPNQPKPRV
jgi:hypothetical protein